MHARFNLILGLLAVINAPALAADSISSLNGGKIPRSVDAAWAGYDPRAEPLETTVVKEWNDGRITFRLVLYTVGTFKGRKARMLAYYAFPKTDAKLPALLHLHGGGQSASFDEVRYAADNGYVGMSLNWGGNKPPVNWDPGDPNTDWGAVDGTHPPQRDPVNHFVSLAPNAFTLDAVPSPRNSAWFLVTLAARRAITFLDQQPEVDPSRIGVHGHSMGGQLTVYVAGIDSRVKAAVPACGGAGEPPDALLAIPGTGLTPRPAGPEYEAAAMMAYLPRITWPILALSPTNDFNAPMDCLFFNFRGLASRDVRYSITPHMNHRHTPEFAVCDMLWFEQQLKGTFAMPQTPRLEVNLSRPGGVPQAIVRPDRSADVAGVDVYYSTDPHVLTRFWRHAAATHDGDTWNAECPLVALDHPLYVYANVSYPLTHKLVMVRRDTPPDHYCVSSCERLIPAADLVAAGVRATDTPCAMIDDFDHPWQDWYRLEWGNPEYWEAHTRKLTDPKWRGPEGAKLLIDVRSTAANTLRFSFDCGQWGAFPGEPQGRFSVVKSLAPSNDWQTVAVSLDDLEAEKGQAARKLTTWRSVTEFSLDSNRKPWRGEREFRNLRWEGGPRAVGDASPEPHAAPASDQQEFNRAIQESLEQEKRDTQQK